MRKEKFMFIPVALLTGAAFLVACGGGEASATRTGKTLSVHDELLKQCRDQGMKGTVSGGLVLNYGGSRRIDESHLLSIQPDGRIVVTPPGILFQELDMDLRLYLGNDGFTVAMDADVQHDPAARAYLIDFSMWCIDPGNLNPDYFLTPTPQVGERKSLHKYLSSNSEIHKRSKGDRQKVIGFRGKRSRAQEHKLLSLRRV